MEKTRVLVCDKHGEELGAFYYDPTALATYAQYERCRIKLKKSLAPLVHVGISPEGCATTKSGRRIIRNAEKNVYQLFDCVLGYRGASKAFFEKVRPFARVGDKFYCEQCVDALRQYIQKQGGK